MLSVSQGVPDALPPALSWLTTQKIHHEKTKPNQTPIDDPFFGLCEELIDAHARSKMLPKARFFTEARNFLREHMGRAKREQRRLYFDDLLTRLDASLQSPQGGAALAEVIRRRYPHTLVDEFQDTDPAQYRIIRTVYENQPECGLLMCGDPKQAIYAFRGADVFSYMEAKARTPQEARFTLDTNWRSSSRMIDAFNHLFTQAAAPFIFEPDITYEKVLPSPRADKVPLLIDGVEAGPLATALPAPDCGQRIRVA